VKRKLIAGLMAVLVLGGIPAVYAAKEHAEASAAEMQVLSENYTESAQPRLFPWVELDLRTEDHRRVLRVDGRILAWGSYPEITVEGGDYPALKRALRNWNMEQKQAWENSAESMEETARELRPSSAYYDYTVVDRWGRVDDAVVSFALRHEDYAGGAHPLHGMIAENINAETGEKISIDEVVNGRELLLTALAEAFRTQYPGREKELFAQDIDEALDQVHIDEDWQESVNWMLDANNDLVVFYNPYELGPYAAGSFELTVHRDEFPEVFWPDLSEE